MNRLGDQIGWSLLYIYTYIFYGIGWVSDSINKRRDEFITCQAKGYNIAEMEMTTQESFPKLEEVIKIRLSITTAANNLMMFLIFNEPNRGAQGICCILHHTPKEQVRTSNDSKGIQILYIHKRGYINKYINTYISKIGITRVHQTFYRFIESQLYLHVSSRWGNRCRENLKYFCIYRV